MFYTALTTFIVLLGLVALLCVCKLLFMRGGMLVWLRGMIGLVLIVLTGTCALMAWDMYSYRQVMQDQAIATISFRQLGEQAYIATLVTDESSELGQRAFELHGDQWQLDARIVRWHGVVRRLGAKPGYRLERIAGRYTRIDDERHKARTLYALSRESVGVDLWSLANRYQSDVAWVEAVYGNATFLPMVDQGKFEIYLSDSGILAKPINEPAQKAVNLWL